MPRRPPEANSTSRRLEADYQDRFAAIGGGFSAWVSPTQIGVEALFGGRIGPLWATSVDFGKRRFSFGRVTVVMTLEEAEKRIRAEIEEYLQSRSKLGQS